MKKCKKCSEIKSLKDFFKISKTNNSPRAICKTCANNISKKYRAENHESIVIFKKKFYQKNKQKVDKNNKKYFENNKEKIKKYLIEYRLKNIIKNKEYKKEYRAKNKEKINSGVRKRKSTDIQFKLSHSLRSRLGAAIKIGVKSGSAVRDLGCSIQELKTYLESKFQEGMTWENWSRNGWHIDHIQPLSSFDLTQEDQLKKACHYSNLQPLWAVDNLKKSDKIGVPNV